MLGFCLTFWFLHGKSQSSVDVGFEFQAYPTGLMPGLRLEVPLNPSLLASFRAGYNFIRHGDSGKHDDERGHGWGATIGLKRYFAEGESGWFAGLRTGVWFNSLDWKDNIGQTDPMSGKQILWCFSPLWKLVIVFAKRVVTFSLLQWHLDGNGMSRLKGARPVKAISCWLDSRLVSEPT